MSGITNIKMVEALTEAVWGEVILKYLSDPESPIQWEKDTGYSVKKSRIHDGTHWDIDRTRSLIKEGIQFNLITNGRVIVYIDTIAGIIAVEDYIEEYWDSAGNPSTELLRDVLRIAVV